MRMFLSFVFVVFAAALLVWSLWPAAVPVSSALVTQEAFAEVLDEEGRTRLRESFSVSTPISGFLQRVTLEVGDAVAAGDVLFRLEPLPAPALDQRSLEQARENLSALRARFESTRAQLETQRADAAFAEAEHRRFEQLRERNLVSEADMERVRSTRDRQRAAVQAAEHAVAVAGFEVESARAILEVGSGERGSADQPLLEIRAPVSGVILRRHRCCEGTLQAGEVVLELGNLEQMEVQVDLLSMDAVRVAPGMSVHIGGWGGDQIFAGRVRRVSPAGFTRVSALGVDEQRVSVFIDFLDPARAAEHLGAGFRVEAFFILWQDEDVVQVPTGALFRDGDGWAVFVIESQRAMLRRVEPGRRSGMRTQIVSGLAAGERVIIHPGDRVVAGVRVAQS
jgi:HlyD family secretion protein